MTGTLDNDERQLRIEADFHHGERAHDRADAVLDSTGQAALTAGNLALRSAMWINGGAAVAVLSFIGSLSAGGGTKFTLTIAIAETLSWFAAGAATSVVGMSFGYLVNYYSTALQLSQTRHWEHPYLRPGPSTGRWSAFVGVLQAISVGSGIISIVCFVSGVGAVRAAIINLAGA